MRYVLIPGTDLMPSAICMGGGPLCTENDDRAIGALLDTFYEKGGTFIDSANIYGKWLPSGKNVCDINIGRWLRSRGVREKVVVTSKGGHPPLSKMAEPRLKKDDVRADLDESLRALGSDCIDLYYLHRDDPSIPVEYVIDYLRDFVKEGKIRYFATSNWKAPRIRMAQEYARKSGKQGFSANQLLWSFAVPDMSKAPYPMMVSMDAESKRYHIDSGLAAIGYESQAKGFFQKQVKKEAVPLPRYIEAMYGSEENVSRCHRAEKLAQALGTSLADITLGYVLNQPFASFAVIGSHSPEQLTVSLAAADMRLTPEQIAYLEGNGDWREAVR